MMRMAPGFIIEPSVRRAALASSVILLAFTVMHMTPRFYIGAPHACPFLS